MEECLHDSDEEKDDIFVENLFRTGKMSTQNLQTGTLTSDCVEQSSDQSENSENDNKHKPIFSGCDLKLGTAMLLLCLLMMKHNLTQSAMDDLLVLLTVLLPNGNLIARSYSEFSKFFGKLKHPLRYHYYCSFCLMPLKGTTDNCCANKSCLQDLTAKGSKSYFVEVPIISQLQTLFSRPGFHDSLLHRFKWKSGSLRDIYDGRVYKELSGNGVLNSPDAISFLINTDGAPVFKSSKVSIWPVYLMINELPLIQRRKKENIIFAGLWFGDRKPIMLSYLEPTFDALNKLEQGVNMCSSDRGEFLLKAALIACSCDLPAHAMITNFVQYNGRYSCPKCAQSGETLTSGKGGYSLVFPFQPDDPSGPRRTPESLRDLVDQVKEQNRVGKKDVVIQGVKGPSWLMTLRHFPLIKGIAIDYMHGVLLGVQKLLLHLWFSNDCSKQEFNIREKLTETDARLSQIKPPSNLKRLPRSIGETLKYWKASELRSFLLYYGVPILHGLLPQNLLQHYILLVHATFILLKDGSTVEELQHADHCLLNFVEFFIQFYGLRYATLNIHQLIHLVDDALDLGPLYTHDLFALEDKNRELLNFIHGTQQIDSQITTAISYVQKIPELITECIEPGSIYENLVHRLTSTYTPKLKEELIKGVFRLGALSFRSMNKEELLAINDCLGYAPISDKGKFFSRIVINSAIYVYGKDYKRMHKRDNSIVKLIPNRRGLIFAEVQRFVCCNSKNILCLANALVPRNEYNEKCHITSVKKEAILIAFPIEMVMTNCVCVNYEVDKSKVAYVCEFPNRIQAD